jgi:hypothetical protein
MGKTVSSFVRSNQSDRYSLMPFWAIAGQLNVQAVVNRRHNPPAIFLHAVYLSHATILPCCLPLPLGSAGQVDWPFA